MQHFTLPGNRLSRMREVMSGHVESRYIPGAVTVVSRGDDAHIDTFGTTAFDRPDPMRPDTIFRIASVTKLCITVATLMLVEECRLRLDDPVDDLLPELADRRVLTSPDAEISDTVLAHRPITVEDLLTFRSGLGIVMNFGTPTPFQAAVAELEIPGFGAPTPDSALDPDEWMRRVSTLPLLHQPGENWFYNTGSSILGVLIARAAGQPLEEFLAERVFRPLGMVDTSFSVPADKLDRLATLYSPVGESDSLRVADEAKDSVHARPPAFPDGAAGLLSTANDLLAFGRMLLGCGKIGGGKTDGEKTGGGKIGGTSGDQRLLSRATSTLMTTDQLSADLKRRIDFFPGLFEKQSWGMGVGLVTKRTRIGTAPGQFGWDGGHGTALWCDPAADLIGILLTQRAGYPPMTKTYQDFWTSAYQAID